MIKFSEYKLGEIITAIQTGKTPSTNNPLYFDGDIPWVTPSDLKGQKYVTSTGRNLSEQAVIDKQAFLYPENSVLISTIGDIGKVAIAKQPTASNQQITGIKVNEKIILSEFLYYWLFMNKEHLYFKANKAVIPILNNKVLKTISIEIPSDLEYQRKVVLQLDTIQQLIDKRIQSLDILNSLKESLFLNMFASNAYQWEYKELSCFVENTQYGLADALSSDPVGYPIIRMNNISYKGDIDLTNLKYIELNQEKFNKYELKERDILFNRTNSNDLVGKTTVWKKEKGYVFAGYIFRIKLNENRLNPYYLSGYLNSRLGKELLRNKAKVSGSMANISSSLLLKQKILEAPIDLQKTFEFKYIKLEEQTNYLRKSISILQELFQSVLQNIFIKNTEINEAPIFKELIERLSLDDLKGNKRRLQYLIDLFKNNQFDDEKSYSSAKEKLFDLIVEEEIEQVFADDNIELRVK